MSNTETVPVFVIQRRSGEKDLAARGFGWPTHEETAKSNQQFVEEMQRLKRKIDVEAHDPETKVAELTLRRLDSEITDVTILTES